VKRHDLNELLVTHPAATFMWRVSGQSMIEAGIFDGDVIVVNRALTPAHRDIVVAQVDGEFTVKYLHKRADRVKLLPANPTYSAITFREGQQLIIVGVVTARCWCSCTPAPSAKTIGSIRDRSRCRYVAPALIAA
jgi:DNA polymerase V